MTEVRFHAATRAAAQQSKAKQNDGKNWRTRQDSNL